MCTVFIGKLRFAGSKIDFFFACGSLGGLSPVPGGGTHPLSTVYGFDNMLRLEQVSGTKINAVACLFGALIKALFVPDDVFP